jgi:hypothetical protein
MNGEVGSLAIGAFIARVAFWVLIAMALQRRRFGVAAIFVGVWALALLGLPRIGWGALMISVTAALDVLLILVVLGRDVRLT